MRWFQIPVCFFATILSLKLAWFLLTGERNLSDVGAMSTIAAGIGSSLFAIFWVTRSD